MNNLFYYLSMLFILAACGPLPLDVNRKTDYYLSPNGGLIKTCRGDNLVKNSLITERFWKENNLPHGTTYFVCRDGKAYLPENAPPK